MLQYDRKMLKKLAFEYVLDHTCDKYVIIFDHTYNY